MSQALLFTSHSGMLVPRLFCLASSGTERFVRVLREVSGMLSARAMVRALLPRKETFSALFTAPSPISTVFSVLMSRCSLSASKKKPFGGPLSVHIKLGFPCQFLYGSGSLHSPSIMWSGLKVYR